MHGDCFETELLHESLQGVEADIGVVIELRDASLVDRRNGVEPLGQNFPAEPRRCLKKCDVEKSNRKPFEQMGHHQPTRTASDDCQLKHAPPTTERYVKPMQLKIVERLDQNVKLTHCGKASRMVIPSNRDNVW